MRDGEPLRYLGKGVRRAVENVEGPLADAVRGLPATEQQRIDQTLRELDGTANKERYGANALLGISLAAARPPPTTCRFRSTSIWGDHRPRPSRADDEYHQRRPPRG